MGIDGAHARRALAAHPAAVPRQPADRRRRGAGGARPGAHARHARLHARQDGRRRDRRAHRRARRPDRRSRSRTCTRSWRSPTTRTASSSRPRIARPAEDAYELRGACGFTLRQRLLAAATTPATCSGGKLQAPRPRWRSRDEDAQGPGRAAVLSDRRARQRRPTRSARRSTARPCCRRRERAALASADRRSRGRRPLRPAGALRPAVRPHALAVAASLRARARREPRPRPGDGRSAQALRGERLHADAERAARLPAAVPGICLAAPAARRRSSCSASRPT